MCDVYRCKRPAMLGYEAFGARRTKSVLVCQYHWERHCDEDDKFDLVAHFYPEKKG